MCGMLGVERFDSVRERLARSPEGFVFPHIGEAPGGALNVARLQRHSDAPPLFDAANPDRAVAAALQKVRSFFLVRALLGVPSLKCEHGIHSSPLRACSR